MKEKLSYALIALAIGMTVPVGDSWAGSVAGTGGATEVTQILNNVQLMEQSLTQAQQLQVQLQQAVTNPNAPWSQTLNYLQDLRSLYNTAQSIGYSMQSAEQGFKNLYQGYGQGSGNMLDKIVAWGNQTRSAVSGELTTAGWTMDQIKSADQTLESLRMQSQTAVGQMQAAQVGNAIAVEMVQQLRSLSQLQAAQAQAHASYLAGLNEKAASDDANLRALIPTRRALPW
ncbi:P-type conjugative transfer protein TrbJ [Burkholderia sp. LMG 13014]|uniref:P-type conjugative transfer protein TrbJ n=1 Tax=Burkholderia sp. LMG 13014 TaxID=2709306 RepID=UPI0019645DE4|nr:P-type conjugative transfer protein TrbJ [Burkholderia sp. LMG 13014]